MKLKDVQFNYNNSTTHKWESWRRFRDMNRDFAYIPAITHNKIKCKRALILGAGNGNDIDISFLENKFNEIVIVDIDPMALQNFLSKVNSPEKFHSVVMDLSGVEESLDSIHTLEYDQIERVLLNANPIHDFSKITGTFDFVLSSNFTSQLILPYLEASLKQRNLTMSKKITEAAADLTSKIIDNIFREVGLIMDQGGVFLHSTDMYVISANTKNNTYSEAYKPVFVDVLRNNMQNIGFLLDLKIQSKLSQYTVIGSYLPNPDGILKGEAIKFIPWRFNDSAAEIRYYICRVVEYKKL